MREWEKTGLRLSPTPAPSTIRRARSSRLQMFMARLDRLIAEATPSRRIVQRQAIQQLMSLLPHLSEAQQLGGLRRLRQLLERSQFNLHVCTAGLQLVSVVLRWLTPEAPVLPPVVLTEVLELLSVLGGYRATAQELRTLFDLLQGAVTSAPARDGLATGMGGQASAEQLLDLLARWCEPSAFNPPTRDAGPRAPKSCFDFDGAGEGLTLPSALAADLVSRGAFTLGGWVRLEDEVAGSESGGMLLFSMMNRSLEVGVEIFLQPTLEQLAISVHGGSSSATAKLLRRGRPPPEKSILRGISLTPGRWHLLLVSLRRAAPMRGRHEAVVSLDGQRVQATPCPYPASLTEKAASASQPPSFHVGAAGSGEGDGKPSLSRGSVPAAVAAGGGVDEAVVGNGGFAGQMGTVLVLRGVPTDAEASAIWQAGTRCSDLDAVCAAASAGSAGMMAAIPGSTRASIQAAFDAATAHAGACAAVSGAAGMQATLGDGVSVLRPLDVRASLGGPLPLLPLIPLVGDAVRAGHEAQAGLLSRILRVLTSLLRGELIYLVELERTETIGMLAHLLAETPAATVDAELLASVCALENALEGSAELSSQLLQKIFLRVSVWARGGCGIVLPLLRQLNRMAGDRSEHWARTDSLSRLHDAMIDVFPWRPSSSSSTSSSSASSSATTSSAATDGIAAVTEASPTYAGAPAVAPATPAPPVTAPPAPEATAVSSLASPATAYTDDMLRAVWDGAFDVLCSMAESPVGVPPSELRYVVYTTLRSGSPDIVCALLNMLVRRTYARDMRVIDALLEGGSSSLAFAVLTSAHGDDASTSTTVRTLAVKLIGRVMALAEEGATAGTVGTAARWVSHSTWSKCGLPWLSSALSGAPVDADLLEAVTEVLLGAWIKPAPHRSSAVAADAVADAESAAAMEEARQLEEHLALGAEGGLSFSVPRLLPLLLTLTSKAPPKLQQSTMLKLSVWLRSSHHLLLTQQPGWQLPLCSMLNDVSADSDAATTALCVRLLAEHVVAALRQSGEAQAGWAEVQLSIAFIETHTVTPREVKHAVFNQILELLRGKLPLPKTPVASPSSAGASGSGGATSASSALADAAKPTDVMATWGFVLRLLVLIDESISLTQVDPMEHANQPLQTAARSATAASLGSSLVRRLLTGTSSRPATAAASSTRHSSAGLNFPTSGGGSEDMAKSAHAAGSSCSSQRTTPSFTVELEADAAVARLLRQDVASCPPLTRPASDAADDAGSEACGSDGGPSETTAAADPPFASGAAAMSPMLPPATGSLSRDKDGVWLDCRLAVRLLQLVDPLIVQAIVDPLASYTLHMSASSLLARSATGGAPLSSVPGSSVLSAVRSLGDRLMEVGGLASEATSRPTADSCDTLCDIVLRLQLLVLMECDPDQIAEDFGGFDPSRQLQELLLCAAGWCQKPASVDESATASVLAASEPPRALLQQQLGHAMARLMQAWPVAAMAREHACGGAAGAERGDCGAAAAVFSETSQAPTPAPPPPPASPASHASKLVSTLAPVVQGLLRMEATADELRSVPSLTSETPSAVLSVVHFVDSWQSWRAILLREPYVSGLRALEAGDTPAKVASERWAARQRALVAQEDRAQREQRSLAERMQAEATAALRQLAAEMSPRVAVARSISARARVASEQQWQWTSCRLRDDDPIWGGASSLTKELPPTLRVCEWLDLRRRHMLVVPDAVVDPAAPRTRSRSGGGAGFGSGAAREKADRARGSADAASAGSQGSAVQSHQESAAALSDVVGGVGGESTEHRLVGTGLRSPKLLTTLAHAFKASSDATGGDGGEDDGGDEDDEEEEGEEEADDDHSVGFVESEGERVFFHTEADLVRPYGLVPGKILISDRHLRFLGSGGLSEGSLEGDWSAMLARDSALIWPLGSVKQMHRRRYLMSHSALELFDDAGNIFLFNFRSQQVRTRVRRWLKRKCHLEYRDRDRRRAGFRQLLHELQEAWQRRELSNFEYLMRLNELAGRTHNDLNQYPVFPWVLSDYTSATLNLADPASFRDLSRPMGAQVEAQRELVANMYAEFSDPDIPRFHYGSHYSTMGFVLYYLMRVEPFTSYHKSLQSGRFDHADRLFHSLARTYHSCTHSSSDVKELVPELFYLPDVLLNRNRCPLGTRQDGQQVDDVELPPWAHNSADFIAKHRAALECDHVSSHLHEWIDLIFGCKQRGKGAQEALNVFFYLTYEVDLRGRSHAEVRALKAQINNFGQTPTQLMLAPHPQRRPKPITAGLSSRRESSSATVAPSSQLRLDAVPLAMLPLDEALVFFDGSRLVHCHRVERGRGLSPSGSTIGSGEHSRLSAFTPSLPLSRAVALLGTDPRGRDALLVSGAHWDCSLCVSLAHGGGGLRARLRYHSESITCVAVSRCGRWLMSGSLDCTSLLWYLPEGGLSQLCTEKGGLLPPPPSHVFRGHSAAVLCVALSSVLRLAASGSRDGSAALYTLRDGKRVRALREPGGAEVEQVVLCDSGYVVVAAAGGARMHVFTLNGLPVWSWASIGAGVSALQLSLCGGALLCGFDDGSVCVWRLHDQHLLEQYASAPAPIVCLAPADGWIYVGTSRADLLCYPSTWSVDDTALLGAPGPAHDDKPSPAPAPAPGSAAVVDVA